MSEIVFVMAEIYDEGDQVLININDVMYVKDICKKIRQDEFEIVGSTVHFIDGSELRINKDPWQFLEGIYGRTYGNENGA